MIKKPYLSMVYMELTASPKQRKLYIQNLGLQLVERGRIKML
jgi:hypothetical protein